VQDTINPSTSNCNIMLPTHILPLALQEKYNTATRTPYAYARVLGVYHSNVIYMGNAQVDSRPNRIDFLWVCWYLHHPTPNPLQLKTLYFPALSEDGSTSFVDPASVVRACHIIPNFSKGKRLTKLDPQDRGISQLAQDKNDWVEYYVNQ
jgi:hypothetical protein